MRHPYRNQNVEKKDNKKEINNLVGLTSNVVHQLFIFIFFKKLCLIRSSGIDRTENMVA